MLLSSDDKIEDYIVVEVKSLFILKILDDLKKQIKKHIKTMSHIGYAKEYHLCMYTPDSGRFNRLYDDKIEKLKELKELFEDISTEFKVFIIKANYNKMKDNKKRENSNPYQQLMKDKLEKNKNFKEIKL